MSDLNELLERVKAATGTDRALDHGIHAKTNPPLRDGLRFGNVPHYTASVDASLALVERMLPGCGVVVDREPVAKAGGLCGARVYGWIAPEWPEGEGETWAGFDATGASYSLAILAALFAALQSQAPAP